MGANGRRENATGLFAIHEFNRGGGKGKGNPVKTGKVLKNRLASFLSSRSFIPPNIAEATTAFALSHTREDHETLAGVAQFVADRTGTAAQERIEPEQARKFARLFVEQSAKVPHLQLKIDADPDQPFGLKDEDMGAMVIPQKKLAAGDLTKAGNAIVPLGQLWLRNLTLVVKDEALPNDKLRIVTITANGQDHSLPLFLLGVRGKGANLELVVYGPGKEPLLVAPLQKSSSTHELPLELDGEKGNNNRGTLTIKVLGQYQAQLTLAKQD